MKKVLSVFALCLMSAFVFAQNYTMVPEQPKPNSSAMFGSDKVGSGQSASTAGGTTSGTGSGSGKPGWAVAPNMSGIKADRDFVFTLNVTVDNEGNVTAVTRSNNCNAPEYIVNQVIARVKKAKFKKGFAGTYTQPCSIKKN